MNRALIVSLMSMALGACTSDGQLGRQGEVRFSQIVHYAETDDFTAPIAVGRTFLVALQRPEDDGPLHTDGDTYAELTLRVESSDGDAVETVGQLGFAQYTVQFDSPGDYVLVAESDGASVDYVEVKARAQASMRLAQRIDVSSFDADEDSACMSWQTFENMGDVVLRENQTVEIYVVPVDTNDEAMLGLLPLTAVADGPLALDAPLIGHGAMANALVARPDGTLGDPAQLTLTDAVTHEALVVDIATELGAAPVACD